MAREQCGGVDRSLRKGFSLLELSIVLVVIGLVVGGIMTGNDLIKQSLFKKVVAEKDKYASAIMQFTEKYAELPGDITKSSTYWSSCATPATDCNGNGNGYIDFTAGNTTTESLRMWNHLNLAGIYPNSLSGVRDSSGYSISNSPVAPMGGYAIWSVESRTLSNQTVNALILTMGGSSGTADDAYSVLTAVEAYSIDKKVDDGLPTSGEVQSTEGGDVAANSCANSNAYVATGTNRVCIMRFRLAQ